MRPEVLQLVRRVGRRRAVVGVRHRQARVPRIVPAHQVLGRIPRLVGIEKVCPQEERASLAVLLEPADDCAPGLGRECVPLTRRIPVVPAVQVYQWVSLEHGPGPRFLQGHHSGQRVVQVQQGLVALLATVLERRVKAVLEPRVKEMRAVADQLRHIACLAQQPGDVIGGAEIDGLPAIVRPSQDACRHVRPVGDRGKAARVEPGDLGRSLDQEAIQFRRPDRAHGTLSQVVVPERVRDQQDDVLHVLYPPYSIVSRFSILASSRTMPRPGRSGSVTNPPLGR